MSIVQEALKKAHDVNLKEPETGKRADSKNFGPAILLVVFIVLLGVTIKQVAFSPGRSASKPGVAITEAIYKPISTIDSPVAEPYSDASRQRRSSGKFPDFVLNGIMELVDGPRAIINNVIVATGDMVGGATVKKIDKDKVVLQKDKSVVTLGIE